MHDAKCSDIFRQVMKDFDVVVNATGLKARELLNDDNVVPARGQVIKVNAYCTILANQWRCKFWGHVCVCSSDQATLSHVENGAFTKRLYAYHTWVSGRKAPVSVCLSKHQKWGYRYHWISHQQSLSSSQLISLLLLLLLLLWTVLLLLLLLYLVVSFLLWLFCYDYFLIRQPFWLTSVDHNNADFICHLLDLKWPPLEVHSIAEITALT